MKIIVKPTNKKMTPEELQGYLKAKAIGSGVTKNKKKLQNTRKTKYKPKY